MRDSIQEALAGALAGATSKTLLAPLDRLKLVVQLRGSLSSSSSSTAAVAGSEQQQYNGPWRALSKIIREEGFWALWRGNLPTILIQGGTSALNFMFMSWYMNAATKIVGAGSGDVHDQQQRLFVSLVSGGLAGGTAITILYPIGLIRTKLALDVGRTGNRLYPNGMRDVVSQSIRVNGISGLYKGYFVALASVSSYRMIYLGGYDFLKTELCIRKRQNSSMATNGSGERKMHDLDPSVSSLTYGERFFVAQVVSMAASTFHYPLDTIRRRLMMQSDLADGKATKYKSSFDCMKRMYFEEGISGFYRGLGTNYIRSVGAALVLVSYDFFKSVLSSTS